VPSHMGCPENIGMENETFITVHHLYRRKIWKLILKWPKNRWVRAIPIHNGVIECFQSINKSVDHVWSSVFYCLHPPIFNTKHYMIRIEPQIGNV
jgi:hypothetical protein